MRKTFTFSLSTAFFLTSFTVLQAQTVQTFAGGGSHSGVQALQVPMTAPNALAIDGAGNLYVADNNGANIRKIDLSSGIVTTVAGGTAGPEVADGQPAISGELLHPSGVAVDAAGNIYFTELTNKVRVVNFATGLVSTYAGTGIAGYSGDGFAATGAQLSQPRGLAIDALGNLYIADRANSVIRKIDLSGNISTVAGTGVNGYNGEGVATSAQLNLPYGIALNAAGNLLYIADDSNHRVRMVDLGSHMISTVAGDGTFGFGTDGVLATSTEFKSITGVYVDGAGDIYITDSKAATIRKVDAATGNVNTIVGVLGGTPGFAGDAGAPTGAKLAAPISSILDGSGNLFIADQGNQRVREVASNVINTYAGNGSSVDNGDGGPATSAILSGLSGIATDVDGNIYYSDFQTVREVDVNLGIITTVAGNGMAGGTGDLGQATIASICNPSGVYVDVNGNLYICSSCENKVRKVNSSGIISTFAGNGTPGYSGDGFPATSAMIDNVTAITGDAAGNIYINDPVHGVVRKIDASNGNISTVAGTGTPGYSGDGGLATAAQLSAVNGLSLDIAGNLYISDNTPNNVVRKVDVGTGKISTVAGGGAGTGDTGDGGPATAALFGNITSVYADAPGNLYITDKGFNRVRWVNYVTGTIDAFAGTGTASFSGDSGPASSATFSQPSAVARDGVGKFFIADAGNLRIRSVTGVPLPLTLLSFTGNWQNGDVTLKWNTSNEVNTQNFIVERSQAQTAFAAIGNVSATSAAGKNSYSYVDKELAPGSYLYRLKMVDRDAHYTYSPVVAIRTTAAMTGRIVLYPNPVKDVLYVQLQSQGQQTLVLQLSDMQGKILQQQEVQVSRGVTGLSFNTASLAAGSYMILSAGEHKVIGQFIKN